MNYAQLHNGYTNCLRKLRKPDAILALSHGGLFGGTLASNFFGVPFIALEYNARAEATAQASLLAKCVESIPKTAKSVLIVDAICDSGETLHSLKAALTHLDVATLVYHFRKNFLHTPTQFAVMLHDEDGWVTYPWELS